MTDTSAYTYLRTQSATISCAVRWQRLDFFVFFNMSSLPDDLPCLVSFFINFRLPKFNKDPEPVQSGSGVRQPQRDGPKADDVELGKPLQELIPH